MALTIEDWKDRYYEQQALHTESNGMLCQERDNAIRERDEANEAAARAAAAGLVIKRENERVCSYAEKLRVGLKRAVELISRDALIEAGYDQRQEWQALIAKEPNK